MKTKITEGEKLKIKLSTNEQLYSILNLGYNGHPEFWLEAQRECDRRKVYFVQNIIEVHETRDQKTLPYT